MAAKTKSQCYLILEYLQKNPQGITPLDALYHAHCMRLAARISDLKKRGFVIVTEPVSGAQYCRYRLIKEER